MLVKGETPKNDGDFQPKSDARSGGYSGRPQRSKWRDEIMRKNGWVRLKRPREALGATSEVDGSTKAPRAVRPSRPSGRTPSTNEVRSCIVEVDGPFKARQIADIINADYDEVRCRIYSMKMQGELERLDDGYWKAARIKTHLVTPPQRSEEEGEGVR